MSSIISGNSSESDDQFSLLDIASNFYDVERRPFTFAGLKFEELPQATQDFISRSTEQLPSSVSEEEPSDYFHKLLVFRQDQQERLERTLESVHRAIVMDMLAARADPSNQEVLDRLTNVLVPKWRSHLDDYVDEIDALIWFEMDMRDATSFAMLPEQPFKERQEDVRRMVQFAVQCLQNVNEKVKREMVDEMLLLEQIAEQGHLSDASSTSSTSDEHEDDLFSDENDIIGYSSDSDLQWIDVKSPFRRVAYQFPSS